MGSIISDRRQWKNSTALVVRTGRFTVMPKDDRDILEILKFELDFLEQGGYGRSVRTPWKATSAFQDSLTCINFGDPSRSRPCNDCLLMEFVPAERRSENVPCHHIALDESGETVDTLEAQENQAELEERVKNWLRAAIRRIETERATIGSA
jgi:hypothetical protein